MVIFCSFPTTPPFPQRENVVRHPNNHPQRESTGAFTVVKTVRAVVCLCKFSIFMPISFIHVDTETFVPLTCTYTLTL